MGRHSSSNQGPFYRSLLGWFLPWILIAVVVVAAVWLLVNAIGGDEVTPTAADRSPSAARSADPSPTETETEVVIASPEPTAEVKPKLEPKRKKKKKDRPDRVALITEGVNVQVLNGTSDSSADDALAARLEGLGFRIEAIDDSSKDYAQTTVFWSYPEAQKAAEALAERMGWIARPKPENLSTQVALHVVVGGDEV